MPKYVLLREDERYRGWYSVGGYALYPEGIEFNREGPPVIPTFPISNLYEGCGLPVAPMLGDGSLIPEGDLNENALFAPQFDKQEKNLPLYGRQKWVKPTKKNDLYTGYDQEGMPIFPDGSARPFNLMEIQHIRMTMPQVTNKMPKKPDKTRSYKTRKNKNPAPKKPDIDQMFREENDRIRRMKEFE